MRSYGRNCISKVSLPHPFTHCDKTGQQPSLTQPTWLSRESLPMTSAFILADSAGAEEVGELTTAERGEWCYLQSDLREKAITKADSMLVMASGERRRQYGGFNLEGVHDRKHYTLRIKVLPDDMIFCRVLFSGTVGNTGKFGFP